MPPSKYNDSQNETQILQIPNVSLLEIVAHVYMDMGFMHMWPLVPKYFMLKYIKLYLRVVRSLND